MSIVFTPSGSISWSVSNSCTASSHQLAEDDLHDPAPDIIFLFTQFNVQYFYDKLGPVEVKWSKQLKSCAGVCQYRTNSICTIRLSEPLLKFRPRSDLVDTLLHEMIHAYLFVTKNWDDRDGHGQHFKSHMHRINAAAGTTITIYHNFRDEVELYRKHIWRCNGRCRNWPPYFGIVKRQMNRAPGPSDEWHSDHKQKCGGQFIKESEPEGFKPRGKKEPAESKSGVSSKQPKTKTLNEPVKRETDPGFKSGVDWKDVTPFKSTGYVLGTGSAVTKTDQNTPVVVRKKVQTQPPNVNSDSKREKVSRKTKQTKLDAHFSPSPKRPPVRPPTSPPVFPETSDVISVISKESDVATRKDAIGAKRSVISQKNDVIDLTDSDDVEKDFDRDFDLLPWDTLDDYNDGFTDRSIAQQTSNNSSNNSGAAVSNAVCPVCAVEIPLCAINSHLDSCLILDA